MSRPKRWAAACAEASSALQTLAELKGEYTEWRGNLPENLEGSTLAEKLDAMEDIDVDTAMDVISEAEGADLPLGFGRD